MVYVAAYLTLYRLPIAVLAILAALVGVFVFGWHCGSREVVAAWQSERAATAEKTTAALKAAHTALDAANNTHEAALAAMRDDYTIQIEEINDEKERALSAIYSGGLWVRAACPSRDAAPEAGSSASGNIERAERVRLSQPDAEFLVTLAADADKLAAAFREAKALLIADRQLCNVALP